MFINKNKLKIYSSNNFILDEFYDYSFQNNHELNSLNSIYFEEKLLDYKMSTMLNQNTDNFSRSGYSEVNAFFNEASKDYDSDLMNPYWSFSHEILKFILEKNILEHFKQHQTIKLFDAGAGTGNWSNFVLRLSNRINGILFDINPNMLKMAYPKINKLRENSTKIIEGDLEVFSDFPTQRSNLILCMHNVIGLSRNTTLVLKNLYKYLELGGMAFIMSPNKYHAFNFTKGFLSKNEVLRVVNDGTVKFKPDMPEMFCYTPKELEILLQNAGFNQVTVLGFPVTIYPESGDVKLLKKDSSNEKLRNLLTRKTILEQEKILCLKPELAYRGGSSLIAVCKKNI